jgi:DNA-binding FrmR family transcriptional regulator
MAHTIRHKTKLLARVRRIQGQCGAIERALQDELDCSATLQLIAATRGAMNGLMAEVLEQHVMSHLVNGTTTAERDSAAGDLVDVVRAYLK